MHRRAFLTAAASAGILPLALPARARAQAPVPIADMHFHSFFGESIYHSRPVAKTMKDGGATLISWAVSGDALWIEPWARGMRQKSEPKPGDMFGYVQRDLGRIKAHLAEQKLPIVRGPAQVERALKGEPHVVLSVEGASFVENDVSRVKAVYDLGVRHLQVVHYVRNTLGDFQTEKPTHDGLSEIGKRVVRECNRLGILVDLAHCTPKGVNDALAVAQAPVVWSHSSVLRSGTPSWSDIGWKARQLRLEEAKAIAAKGGVVGIWAVKQDVPSIDAYAARMLELAEWLGEDHVAFGTDINGLGKSALVGTYAELRKVVAVWQQNNVPAARVAKLAAANYARVLRDALRPRAG